MLDLLWPSFVLAYCLLLLVTVDSWNILHGGWVLNIGWFALLYLSLIVISLIIVTTRILTRWRYTLLGQIGIHTHGWCEWLSRLAMILSRNLRPLSIRLQVSTTNCDPVTRLVLLLKSITKWPDQSVKIILKLRILSCIVWRHHISLLFVFLGWLQEGLYLLWLLAYHLGTHVFWLVSRWHLLILMLTLISQSSQNILVDPKVF